MLNPMSYEELSAELKRINLTEVEIMQHKAVLIGIGRKTNN